MELLDRIKLSLMVHGNDVADNYKNNSMFFYNQYKSSSAEVLSLKPTQMQLGGFYFITYLDESNWMRYSLIFTADFRKISNQIIIFGVNFNFIPMQIRAAIFDPFMTKETFDKNKLLQVNYQGVYNELRKYGYEYTIVEYNMKLIQSVHKIEMNLVPRFLYSGFPSNKYDPNKLYSIWKVKLKDRDKRHQEMLKLTMDDLMNLGDDVTSNYDVLQSHIDRLQRNMNKFL